jgi:hypothetical protein
MQSPKKKSILSPAKTDRTLANDHDSSLQLQNETLQFQLGERDVECERMKTTLFALNEKLAVMEDVFKDIVEHKGFLKKSEETRNEL